MHQQTLMSMLSTYPAPKASDELMWRVMTQAWLNEEPVRQRNFRQRYADEEPCVPSMMAKNLEKILSTTRSYWSVQLRVQRSHEPGAVPDRAEQ